MMYIDFYKNKDEEPKIHINYFVCENKGDEDEELKTFKLSEITNEELDLAMLTVGHIFPDFETDNKDYPSIIGSLKEEIDDLVFEKNIKDRLVDTYITKYITKNAFYKLVEEGVDIAKHKEFEEYRDKMLNLDKAKILARIKLQLEEYENDN